MLALVSGGVASGKSEIAENLAVSLNTGKMAYIATMTASDEECRNRVVKHRRMRDGKGFDTFEFSYGLSEKIPILSGCDTALLECMGNLIANEMYLQKRSPQDAIDCISNDIRLLAATVPNTVIVTSTIFEDFKAYDDFTTGYIRVLAEINSAIAAAADVVIESVCAIPLIHKGMKELSGYENLV
ncbi:MULTISPECIES: bifunctional adenosylcobinamide kinase/adenosylcobinamide-phosphate guanylyltransferase [unclassified Dehalobacter]|uniref:bifunctional adenosylcobinamide kinase/adenosylcobinamide-phosphate guanylyltransferase n=1 Tax=unclassified Dehalobacter TaxID=2635733 RepID=UPI00037DD10E|nr:MULTISPECIES: bifunctional adenosylcobinamide kinase/adenosylcobinamide-phosphate guanylyltransferase [unclassified Dehalobacter]RJE48564.1 adenosylcobinamide kinase [Dehalobacter sp. MCB1]TCX46699.1 adenosylcobinamide kinase [Dehalobacter sp. 14DCB1]TCX51270.1 adenosylcobinamide kinase [Dehalobacter sp. 12DCB1]